MSFSIDRKGTSIRDLFARTGLSRATIARHTSLSRDEWLTQKAAEREAIRAYHDEGGHSWPETGKHFGLAEDTVKRRAYRARKDRAAEARATAEPTLPLDED